MITKALMQWLQLLATVAKIINLDQSCPAG
jgi:hypothetical protein